MYNPESLHRVRIATKKLRYGLEIAAEGGFPIAAPLVRQLKKVQDTLGRLHDLQVLLTHVAAVQAMPLGRELPEGSLDVLARALEDECRHLHGRYISLSPALGVTLRGKPGRRRPTAAAGRPHSQSQDGTDAASRRTAPADQAAIAGRQRR